MDRGRDRERERDAHPGRPRALQDSIRFPVLLLGWVSVLMDCQLQPMLWPIAEG